LDEGFFRFGARIWRLTSQLLLNQERCPFKEEQRSRRAIEAMLLTAPDLKLSPDGFAIDMMLSAMSGAMRSALETGASPAIFRKLREHLVLLCQSYMAVARARDNVAAAAS
jgi:hypothetical protein